MATKDNENMTKITLGEPIPKMVKIKTLRAICIYENETLPNGKVVASDKIIEPGNVVEVPEELANEYCKNIKGHFAFEGERFGLDQPRHVLTRAVRV